MARDSNKKDGGRRISAYQWIDATNAVGIKMLKGRYGGTYAVLDIAMHFARWVKPMPFYPIQRRPVFHNKIRDTQYAMRTLKNYLAHPN